MKLSENYNFKALYPEVANQWHPTKNGGLTPDKVAPYSNKKAWWMCDRGHEWETVIFNRSRGRGCPHCYQIGLMKRRNSKPPPPNIAKQWHPEKNGLLTPDKVTWCSRKKVWWQCNKGHEWEAVIITRVFNKSGCPYCEAEKKKNRQKKINALNKKYKI